jgi:hypothetical protein
MLSQDQKKRPGTWKIRGGLADEISEESEKFPGRKGTVRKDVVASDRER